MPQYAYMYLKSTRVCVVIFRNGYKRFVNVWLQLGVKFLQDDFADPTAETKRQGVVTHQNEHMCITSGFCNS
mgnify:CR=1 FL=1